MPPRDSKRSHAAMKHGSSGRLVVAWDLGTTWSAVGHFYGADGSNTEVIEVIKNWPGSNNTTEKVPTALVYTPDQAQAIKWGAEVATTDDAIRCVKLMLENKIDFPPWADRTKIERQLATARKSALEVVAEYLTLLKMCTIDALNLRYGAEFVSDTAIDFVVTVPAIWSDSAKEATLRAAEMAGVPRQRIKMIAEPEAAAVFALSTIKGYQTRVQDVYIICDLGGGTADVATYQVTQNKPLRVREFIGGGGRLAGGGFVNLAFEKLLEQRLGRHTFGLIRVQRPKVWAKALQDFENEIKRRFNPRADENEECHSEVSLPGIPDDPGAGLEMGCLALSTQDIRNLFEDCIVQIIELIESQRAASVRAGGQPRAIIMVGGFSQSGYVLKRIQQAFGRPQPASNVDRGTGRAAQMMDILQSAHSWTAVVRGAVMCGHPDHELVTSRKAKRHYGVAIDETWNEGKHEGKVPYYDELLECWRVRDQMEWFVKKGQTITAGVPIRHNFTRSMEKIPDFIDEVLYCCDEDEAPSDCTDPVVELCKLRIDCRKEALPYRSWQVRYNEDEDKFMELGFQLCMNIGSASLTFEMRTNGSVRKSVTANFE